MKPDYTPEVWHCTAEALSDVLGCSADAIAPHADLNAGLDEEGREELGNALVNAFDIPFTVSAFQEFAMGEPTPMSLAACIQTYLRPDTRAGYEWMLKLQAQAQEGDL